VSGFNKLLRYVEFERSCMFGEIVMSKLPCRSFKLYCCILVVLWFFLSVLALFVAIFSTVLHIDSVVYCRLPCRFVAGKLLQLAVLLTEFLKQHR
jgi:hypothetical protein